MTREQVQERADRLVTRLEQWQHNQDRGVLARLRRGLSETTRQEAWTVLGPYFGPLAVGHPVYETVAGSFALHPVVPPPDIGNFGETMCEVMGDKMREEKELHARFRRLLACSSRDEVCQHVRHAIRLAKSRPIPVPVNYRRLFEDLWWWNERTKIQWAKAYWQVPPEPQASSLAGIGGPVEEGEALIPEE